MGKLFPKGVMVAIIWVMELTDRNKLIRKVKITYSVELGIFGALFAVLGALILSGVISVADWKRIAFSYVTLVGGSWLIIDFIWMMVSKKRRAKNSLFDKIIVLPVAITVIIFDIIVFSKGLVHIPDGQATSPVFRYFIGADLLYLALAYILQIIYHLYHPLPSLIRAVDEALDEEAREAMKEAEEAAQKETSEEKPQVEEGTSEETKE